MNQLLDAFQKDMAIKCFSKSTQKSYSYQLRLFLEHCRSSSLEFQCDNVRNYLYGLLKKQQLSNASLKQNIGAIKFFFKPHSEYLMN